MIEIYSFEEWDASQDPDGTLEWGSASQDINSEASHNSSRYQDAPLEVRKMFYARYIHALTTPNIKP